MLVTRRGVEIPKDSDLAPTIKKELTVTPLAFNDPFPKPFRVFTETPTKYVVPMHWARRHGTLIDRRLPPSPAPLTFRGALRDDLFQKEAARRVLETWNEHGGAILCLPVGFGKTTVALYLASIVKKQTVVLVHKSFLKDQWVDRVHQCLPGARVTVIQGDNMDASGDVVVAMIQTVLSRKPTLSNVGLTIIDESHHLAASHFSQCMWGLCSQYTLALTATPRRRDGLMRVVEWFCGPVAFHTTRKDQDSTVVFIKKYQCDAYRGPPPTNRRGDVCYASMISALTSNELRTQWIARLVTSLDPDDQVLVLTHRRAHAHNLSHAIRDEGVESVATYLGGDKACPDTRVIVATYALTSEGFDVPRLNVLVLATPASDVEQSCGRVMRGSAHVGATILDVLDDWGVCWAQHAKRRAFYKASGFRVDSAQSPKEGDKGAEFAFVDE